MSAPVVVIGAGIGGLTSAIELAARGIEVRVLEAAPGPGGKASVTVLDGVEVDTGPSVLTMPDVFAGIFERAGTSLEEQVTLRRPDPAFRYLYPDGAVLDVHHHVDDTIESVRSTLGADAATELAGFLGYAKHVWEAGAPNFVYGPAPSMGTLLRLGVTRFSDVRRIDALRSMWTAITKQVRSQHLRWLLARYATYNGSDVFHAPATLNCIAWVELGLGGFGVEGGIFALVRALVRVAEGLGVTFEYDTPVRAIALDAGRVVGVQTDGGLVPAAAVVGNADAAHIRNALLPKPARGAIADGDTPSTSGWNAVVRASLQADPRPAHAVIFPANYEDEFSDLFEHDRAPRDPTVYVCAQSVCHGRARWPDAEPLFVMANAPAQPVHGPRPGAPWPALAFRVRERLLASGLATRTDPVLWERTPADLAERFPGSRGALYGAASNSTFAAFRRPANRLPKVPGLYLASGSAHPGGGLPLCALSGVAAAEALAEHEGLGTEALRRTAG